MIEKFSFPPAQEAAKPVEDTPEARAAYRVAVFGGASSRKPTEELATTNAEHLGELIARQGFSLNTGGYNAGSMQSANNGARRAYQSAGLNEDEIADRLKGVAMDKSILPEEKFPTVEGASIERQPNYPDRLASLVNQSDAFIAVTGGVGTLLEILASAHREFFEQLREERQPVRPIIIVDRTLRHVDSLRALEEINPGALAKMSQDIYALTYDFGSEKYGASRGNELVQSILDLYYLKSLGEIVDDEVAQRRTELQEKVEHLTLAELLKVYEEFEGKSVDPLK